MAIEFSDHARLQLKKRKISQKLVIDTIRGSKEILPSFRGRKLRRKKFGDKILEVVTKAEGPKITVITAYFLKE